jgi:hypothetical protein
MHGATLKIVVLVFYYFCLMYNMWLVLTAGKWRFRRENVICDDFGFKILVSLKSDKNNGYFILSPMYLYNSKGNGKGKAIPLQSWTDPEGSRRVRFPDFKTIGT